MHLLICDVDEGQLGADLTHVQKAMCWVALKVFAHYCASVNINEKVYGRLKGHAIQLNKQQQQKRQELRECVSARLLNCVG